MIRALAQAYVHDPPLPESSLPLLCVSPGPGLDGVQSISTMPNLSKEVICSLGKSESAETYGSNFAALGCGISTGTWRRLPLRRMLR